MSRILQLNITKFNEKIKGDDEEWKDCHVLAATHCKDAASKVLHEYLHILVANKDYSKWIRLIAERAQQDQVLIYFWPWAQSSSDLRGGGGFRSSGSGSGFRSLGSVPFLADGYHDNVDRPLPLLLQNLVFKENPSLLDVMNILIQVHHYKPDYDLFSANCYWYADVVFETLKSKYGGTVNTFGWIGKKGSKWDGFKAIFGAGGIEEMKKAAQKFDESLKEDPYRGPDGTEPEVQLDAESLCKNAIDDEVEEDNYTLAILKNIKAVNHIDVELTRQQVKKRRDDLIAFTRSMNPETAVHRDRSSEEPPKPMDDSNKPEKVIQEINDAVNKLELEKIDLSPEEQADYEKAIDIFVDGVLSQL